LPSGRTRERRPVTLFDFDALLNGRAEIERIGVLDSGLKPLKSFDRRQENGLGFSFRLLGICFRFL
jgi:hypothetical protein